MGIDGSFSAGAACTLMRILTDSRDRLSEFASANTTLTDIPASLLTEPEEQVWRVLADQEFTWAGCVTDEPSSAFWRRLIVIESAPRSQFDALHEALADGVTLDGPTAAVALTGQRFRGQRGRPWSAVEGNLFLTVGLPVGAPAAELVPGLIMLPAVSVVDAVRVIGGAGVRPSIKWVNDILIDGRKVAGVLASTVCRDGLVEAAVLGIGVNIVHAPPLEPTPFVPTAGCLKDAGINTTVAQFVWCVLDCLAKRFDTLRRRGPAGLLQSYREASCVLGQRVRIWDESTDSTCKAQMWPVPLASGVVTSIADDLSLEIEGHAAPVSRGRLAFEEVCEAQGV